MPQLWETRAQPQVRVIAESHPPAAMETHLGIPSPKDPSIDYYSVVLLIIVNIVLVHYSIRRVPMQSRVTFQSTAAPPYTSRCQCTRREVSASGPCPNSAIFGVYTGVPIGFIWGLESLFGGTLGVSPRVMENQM